MVNFQGFVQEEYGAIALTESLALTPAEDDLSTMEARMTIPGKLRQSEFRTAHFDQVGQ